jgi:hypothetical protein
MRPLVSGAPARIMVARPLFDGGYEALFCLSCRAPGHVCLADLSPLEDELPTRLVLEQRGGALYRRVPELLHAAPFTTPYGALCGGCGCATLAACPQGCWWTRHTRRLWLPHGQSMRFQLCSRCAPPSGPRHELRLRLSTPNRGRAP